MSLGWEPTEEDWTYDSEGKRKSYRGGETEFHQLVSYFIPEDSKVYANLVLLDNEATWIIRFIEKHGFRYESQDRIRRDKWWKRILLNKSNNLYVEADRNFAIYAFENDASWMSGIWIFLISRAPLEDWLRQLDQLNRRGLVTKELLGKIDLFLKNRWEHGLELLSCKLSYEQLIEMAENAARGLGWQIGPPSRWWEA